MSSIHPQQQNQQPAGEQAGTKEKGRKAEGEGLKREAERLKHLCRTIGLHSEVTRVKGKRAKKIRKERPHFVKQFFGERTAVALSEDNSESQQN